MIHVTIPTRDDGKGVDLECRGHARLETYPEGRFWDCEEVEVQNPVTLTWHALTNESLYQAARYEICHLAPTWHPEL